MDIHAGQFQPGVYAGMNIPLHPRLFFCFAGFFKL
jgi:hypothetical protein